MTMTQPEVLTKPYQIAPDVFVLPFQQFAPPVGFHAEVDRIQSLPIGAIASAHTPAIRGGAIARSFGLLRGLPDAEPWAPYTQADLDSWVAAMAGSGHPAG